MEHETELQMVQRHVSLGLAHVKRQREIIAAARNRGQPVELALSLLAQFEDLLRQHEAHLERIDTRG